MDNKCSKYESLFIFSDNETLNEHIKECEDCRKEAEIQDKVSSMLDEVKMYYFAKRKKRTKLRAACAVMFMLLSAFSVFGFVLNDEDLTQSLMYGDTLSAEELGFPVDSYGLLMVDE